MQSPIWGHDETVSFVAGQPRVCWLSLVSPFGDSPTGLEMILHLPEGMDVIDPNRRPLFGVGPDRHRPHVSRDGNRLHLSFPGPLPGENNRRPTTDPDSWCDLAWPLVMIADGLADGGVLRIESLAMGDHAACDCEVEVCGDPGIAPPPRSRRNIQPTFLPWFSSEEQQLLAAMFGRCGITDINLNWHHYGIPHLPADAYAIAAKNLRAQLTGVKIWIGGQPGADTVLPRAEDHYGRRIPQVASPEAIITGGQDIVVASERTWINAVEADGVLLTLLEPAAVDMPHLPAHCFSTASRRRFADEAGLPSVPDPLEILHRHHDAWVAFCCRQMTRVLDVLRLAAGERPLAVCALAPGDTASAEASTDWSVVGDIADILIYAHRDGDGPSDSADRWGHTRIGSTPQMWWEQWHDPLGTVDDPSLTVADCKMQLALSGGHGVRLWSWECFDGQVQQQLMQWR